MNEISTCVILECCLVTLIVFLGVACSNQERPQFVPRKASSEVPVTQPQQTALPEVVPKEVEPKEITPAYLAEKAKVAQEREAKRE